MPDSGTALPMLHGAQWLSFLPTQAARAKPSIQEGAKPLTSALLGPVHSGLSVCTRLDWVSVGEVWGL